MNILKKLNLYLNTLRYLRLNQIFYYILIHIKKVLLVKWYIRHISKLKSPLPAPGKNIHKKPVLQSPHNLTIKSFNFLNKEVVFTDLINWNDKNQARLWLYNLHYFDYLISEEQNESKEIYEIKKCIIEEWINSNPIGFGNGWEPYPLSLRIVNWIYFYHYNYQFIEQDFEFENTFIKSIYHQSAYLSKYIEFHIGANHLFKNAKALLIAGLFFNQNIWLKRGQKILEVELNEQILPDGGHFELSPMYHSIVLEDILDILNFCSVYQSNGNHINREYWDDQATKMLVWLYKIIQPDGNIPLFGDSAFNIALRFDQLKEYTEQILKKTISLDDFADIESLDSSGYYIFRTQDHYLIIDGGKLGAVYQPGHAHGDVFSYEYSYKGTRFIVDSGPGEYLDTELRQKARSITGHNTLYVNELEPGQFWKSFRLGRRIKSPQVEVKKDGNILIFQGKYENNLLRSRLYEHHREVRIIENKYILIRDKVKTKQLDSLQSIIHPNPKCHIDVIDGEIRLSAGHDVCFIIFNSDQYDLEIEEWIYTPEFGKNIESKKIVISPKLIPAKTISYLIAPEDTLSSAKEYFLGPE